MKTSSRSCEHFDCGGIEEQNHPPLGAPPAAHHDRVKNAESLSLDAPQVSHRLRVPRNAGWTSTMLLMDRFGSRTTSNRPLALLCFHRVAQAGGTLRPDSSVTEQSSVETPTERMNIVGR